MDRKVAQGPDINKVRETIQRMQNRCRHDPEYPKSTRSSENPRFLKLTFFQVRQHLETLLAEEENQVGSGIDILLHGCWTALP